MTSQATTPTPHTKWPVAVVIGALASLVLAVVVLAFLWPGKTAQAENLPVSISGDQAKVSALQSAMGQSNTFEFVTAQDRADAVDQIESQQTYGAIVLGSGTEVPEVLTAPAASPVSAQMLTGVATQLQAQVSQQVAKAGGDPASVKVAVTPVVPFSEHDPNGSGLASASFPMAIGGMIGGVLISLLITGPVRRLVAVASFAIFAGLVIAFIMQTWFQYLQGEFLMNALAMGLTMMATASFIVGCTSLIGRAGIGIGAVLTMFIGNPLSGATMPWQFLAAPWGAIGQHLVPGASGSLIRSQSYFPEASTAGQWWTLGAWVLLGVVLTLIGHFRAKESMHMPESTLETAHAGKHAS